MSVTARLVASSEVNDADRRSLAQMKAAVYPQPAESYPGHGREWARPGWGVWVEDGGRLVSYVGVTTRDAEVNGELTPFGGIGGVATHPDHVGNGYASLGMGRALDFLLDMGRAFALLVCRDELVDFYADRGWHLFAGRVINSQFGVTETFTFNRVMLGDLAKRAPTDGVIDLRGPAW